MIDSNSTHDFMDVKAAKHLGCTLKPIAELKVTTVNGNELICKEICRSFTWGMQCYKFQTDSLILPLDNYDMVLGIQRLFELGDIVWNFKLL